MSETTADPPTLSMRDWDRIADRLGPKLGHWLLASLLAAGAMLMAAPVQEHWHTTRVVGLVLLTPLVFLLGWMAGMRTFSYSCESFRRLHGTSRLRYLAPILLVGIAAIGLFGSRYWWLFALIVAFMGHRKGTQRAWWAAVACLAFVFRGDQFGIRIATSDDEALAKAKDAVNESIRRGVSSQA